VKRESGGGVGGGSRIAHHVSRFTFGHAESHCGSGELQILQSASRQFTDDEIVDLQAERRGLAGWLVLPTRSAFSRDFQPFGKSRDSGVATST
jgi:hypothetical protein